MRKGVIIAGLILVLQLALAPLYCENFNAKSWKWQSCIETTSTDYNFSYGKVEMVPSSSVILQGDEIKEVKGHDIVYYLRCSTVFDEKGNNGPQYVVMLFFTDMANMGKVLSYLVTNNVDLTVFTTSKFSNKYMEQDMPTYYFDNSTVANEHWDQGIKTYIEGEINDSNSK